MNVYFLDRPLCSSEVVALTALLRGMAGSAQEPLIRQFRVPYVLPAPAADGRPDLALPRYVGVLRKHFVRAGANAQAGETLALALPQPRTRFGGVLALALRRVTGRLPYLIVRGAPGREGLRLIDVHGLADWLDRLQTGPSRYRRP